MENTIKTTHTITVPSYYKKFDEELNNEIAKKRGLSTQTTYCEGSKIIMIKHDYINNDNYTIAYEFEGIFPIN